ncbi:hypothetical protein ACN47E_005609 [Coniothyrium glycines]
MPLTISLITSPLDIPTITPFDHSAWLSPPNPQLKHFRPAHHTRAEAIAHATARFVRQLEQRDPDTFMVKATDDQTGQIVGWAVWAVNDAVAAKRVEERDTADGEAGGGVHATWYPEGSEEREFAEIFINGLWGFLAHRVPRRHMDLHSITVDPTHRHRGAGRLLIRWGLDKADELGIETVISSLPSARGAYEKCGLGCVEVIPPDPKLEALRGEKGEKWKNLLEDDLSGWLMWRPIGRDWREGDVAPWMECDR